MSYQIRVDCPYCDETEYVNVDLSDECGNVQVVCDECACEYDVDWEVEVSHSTSMTQEGNDDEDEEDGDPEPIEGAESALAHLPDNTPNELAYGGFQSIG